MIGKRGVIVVSVALAAALILSSFAATRLLTPDSYEVQAQKIFNDARLKLMQMRNITIPDDITLHVITKQQAQDMWGHPTGTPDLTNINREERIYKGLFIMPENDSLYQANSEWVANWAAATSGKDIYVIRENFNPFASDAENTFVHEFMHIWQSGLSNPTTYDEDKAHTCLIEGDASFMADYYANWTKTHADVISPMDIIDDQLFDSVHPLPNTLSDINYFPYEGGKAWVEALYDQGGFVAVDQAYEAGYQPTSTAQILHPNLYFDNFTAQPTSAPTVLQANWTVAQTDRGQDHNTYGELFIQEMVARWTNDTYAQQTTAGWDGDNFTYYERGNDYLFTWNITWTNADNALAFSQAFNVMMTQTGASQVTAGEWQAYGRYLTFTWNPTSESTLIACSTVEMAVLPTNFE